MTKLVITILVLNVFAPYVGSWLPPLAGSPAGGIIRDLTIVTFASCTFIVVLRSPKLPLLQVAYLIIWFWLFAWMATLVVTGGQINAGILGARNLILFPLVGLFALINIQKGTISYNSIKKCIYVLGAIASILVILDVATNGQILVMLGYKKDYADGGDLFNLVVEYLGFRRASGGLVDSLNYGYTMSLFSTYFMYGLIEPNSNSKLKTRMSYLLVLFSSIAVILSLTRGAILVMVIGFMMFVIRCGSVRFKFAFLTLSSIGIFAFAASDYGELLYGRFTDSEKISAQSSQSRIDMAINSLDVVIKYPFGIGLGTQGAGTKFISDDMRINTDNFFLWVLVESGVMGLFLLLVASGINYIICFKYAWRNKPVFLLCTYMLIAYVITGMLSSAQISPLYSLLYWVIINIESVGPALSENSMKFTNPALLPNA